MHAKRGAQFWDRFFSKKRGSLSGPARALAAPMVLVLERPSQGPESAAGIARHGARQMFTQKASSCDGPESGLCLGGSVELQLDSMSDLMGICNGFASDVAVGALWLLICTPSPKKSYKNTRFYQKYRPLGAVSSSSWIRCRI